MKSVTLNDATLAHEGAIRTGRFLHVESDFYMLSQMLGFYDLVGDQVYGDHHAVRKVECTFSSNIRTHQIDRSFRSGDMKKNEND